MDKFYRLPRETRSYYGANFGREYIRSLVAICKAEKVDWIVPIGDEETENKVLPQSTMFGLGDNLPVAKINKVTTRNK